ncbi:unnamed protein product [Effrenium voratum]|uniref:Uncharacterized protein n=1 Tax=Effrenium voratum TaxID=2562239 RepID=A0AA36NBY3_9DINO|nr:unnamed protein product [Effrenium voratum]
MATCLVRVAQKALRSSLQLPLVPAASRHHPRTSAMAYLGRVLPKAFRALAASSRTVLPLCRPFSYALYQEQKALAEPAAVAMAKAVRPPRNISLVVGEAHSATEQRTDASRVALCLCGRVKPTFGWPQDAQPSCCSKCRSEGMLKLRGPRCRCGVARPVFGKIGDERPTCCSKCKAEGMVDLESPKCLCGRASPSFGLVNDERASCCSKCKSDAMVNIVSRRCMCGKAVPSFGFTEDTKPLCCKKCKEEGMVNLRSGKCKCGKARSSFGFIAESRPSRCKECKEKGMVDIVTRKCNCGKAAPSFGFFGDARPSCCSKCRTEGMVDIKHRRCKCGNSHPSFGFVDDERATACRRCKTDRMVDIVNPRCHSCGKLAAYPDAAGRPRQLCAVHSAEVGAHTLSSPGRSRIASEFLDALEIHIGRQFPFRHRFDAATGQWSGEEFAGLVANRNLVPDAYDPEARILVELLGNFYHGFPPEHSQHASFTWAADQHRKFMQRPW